MTADRLSHRVVITILYSKSHTTSQNNGICNSALSVSSTHLFNDFIAPFQQLLPAFCFRVAIFASISRTYFASFGDRLPSILHAVYPSQIGRLDTATRMMSNNRFILYCFEFIYFFTFLENIFYEFYHRLAECLYLGEIIRKRSIITIPPIFYRETHTSCEIFFIRFIWANWECSILYIFCIRSSPVDKGSPFYTIDDVHIRTCESCTKESTSECLFEFRIFLFFCFFFFVSVLWSCFFCELECSSFDHRLKIAC